MLPSRRACVLEATLAGVAFGGLELLASGWAPALDPPAGALGAAGVVGTGLLCGVFALFPWRPRLVTALIWALIWGPEAARVSGVSVWLGVAPALVLLTLAKWPRRALWIGVLGGLLVPLARPKVRPAPAVHGPGALLVTVDTVRADSGLLELLDLEGCATGAAVSPAPWTLPAMASLWTGGLPEDHGAGRPVPGGWTGLSPDERGLGAHMPVEAWLSNPHLRSEVGFGQGITALHHSDLARHPVLLVDIMAGWRARILGVPSPWDARRDEVLVRHAEASMRDHTGGLVWVHLLSPHEHNRFDEGPARGQGTVGPPAYRNNVGWTASRVQRLVDAAGGRRVLVVADHGESFGEGGHQGHGTALVAEQLRVPAALCLSSRSGGTLAPDTSVMALREAWLSDQLPGRPSGPVRVGGLRTRWAFGWWPGGEDAVEHGAAEGVPAPISREHADALETLGYRVPE